ncbi:hypothetical protein [Yoonia sp.]|uniref:hypothetical protein n=1 Tax=Yoonia sp. TaxID=2212373 RepID=UPI00358E3228
MKNRTWLVSLSVGGMILLGACAPKPVAQVIYAEPVFNKFGNPSCRPGDVPIGGAYTADLPLCSVIGGAPAAVVVVPAVDGIDTDGTDGTPDVPGDTPDDPGDTPDDPGDDPTGGNQNQNQNGNNNQNQNQNNEQNNQQSGNG